MIGMNLKYFRKKEGLSQEELAEKIEVSRQSVAKWESGETLPDIVKCRELANLFGTTIDNLINYSFEEEKLIENETDGKFVFGIVKVGEKGQVVIPKHAREVFKINPGDKLVVLGDTKQGGIAFAKIPGLESSFK
ncbi:helix-turn-helix domain-containing protein [Ruminococcus sp.]|uniref:helix-turn-helix domain-containing protein n=1 Tax=Ruminococcus sp. TaxID=41978 RepID=UPI0025DB94FE|nr:helix-turn-helix domain-containing protein [Ruminococcus sp.]MCI6615707.1 helix-turn-helix domain-containing protein [Ruminococcus sp.]